LQLLTPFPAWDGHDFLELPVLVKASGKCTTDQISAAGKWLNYRGHLEHISDNLFLGVVNAFDGAVGEGRDPLDGERRPFPETAKRLSERDVAWCFIGDANIGEGSSRVLALSFRDPSTYDLIKEDDRISVTGLANLAPGVEVRATITRRDGTVAEFGCSHTYTEEQIEWFSAGSALNVTRRARAVSHVSEMRPR
jgi:aconitate hydratase